MKKVIIGICVLAIFIKLFPNIFWGCHNLATKSLRVHLYKGMNDLEYEYGQDIKEPVSKEKYQEYTIFYPTKLNESYPIVVWGNGTANTYKNYEPSLMSLASYGFVVVGCLDSNMGNGDTLISMAENIKSLNEDSTSIFYHHLMVDSIGVAGHSQGACGAVNALNKRPDLFSSLFTTSLPKIEMCVDKKNMEFAYWKYDISKVHVPYFANTGTRFLDSLWISPLSSMKDNFSQIDKDVEVYMAREIHANHNIVNEYHGCGYFNAWFSYTLKNDQRAGTIFKGENPELMRNKKRWTDFLSFDTLK